MSTWEPDDLQKGFSYAHLARGTIDGLSALPDVAGNTVFVDPDGFPFAAVGSKGEQG